MLLARALLAVLALPVVVGGLFPAFLASGKQASGAAAPLAIALMAVGGGTLLWCAWSFYAAGKGTLAPWDPPRHLVVTGLYRFVRNPMYLAVAGIVGGWVTLFQSIDLLVYLSVVIMGFQWRVVFYEEPRLKRQFGQDWDSYSKAVPRWIPTTGGRTK